MDLNTLRYKLQLSYQQENWKEWLGEIFGRQISFETKAEHIFIEKGQAKQVERFASIALSDYKNIAVLDILTSAEVQIARNRVALREIVFKLIDQDKYHGLLVFYHSEDEKQNSYRLSFISNETIIDVNGSLKAQSSEPKRFTYLLGENEKTKTPSERLKIIANKRGNATFEDIKNAFSVETLTKEFYAELFAWYQWALSEDIGVTFPNDRSTENDDRQIEEHIIRLITRLMFVWFIKQKELIPDSIFETEKLKNILNDFDATSSSQDNYYRAILQNLFFGTLNNKIEDRSFAIDGTFSENKLQYGIKTLYRYADEFSISTDQVIELFSKVPFLNGGLFECLDKESPDSDGRIMYSDGFSRRRDRQSRAYIPNVLFFEKEKGLIPILNKYNFTIEENTPSDVVVALDPELLGKVFENLLGTYNPETKETARKQSGSFYTPREIVNYMVNESLMAYLTNCINVDRLVLNNLVDYGSDQVDLKLCSEIYKALLNIKILDPACGSGAFPMGVLNRILEIIEKLPLPKSISTYELKLHLIENCIYGVDIQSIAVQISKLRFFISLICEQTPNDEEKSNYGIKPLPNLETKFVAANTLIGLAKKNSMGNLFEDPQIEVTKKSLIEIRHLHFAADTAKKKREYRTEDKKLREKLAKLLEDNNDFAPEDAKQLASWNPYDQNQSSPFFDPEWMFGLSKENGHLKETGYFDIVIGNPPYVNLANIIPDNYRNLLKEKYRSARNKSDLYAFFIEQGFCFLKTSGLLTYIIPHTWKATDSFKNLREIIFREKTLLQIVNLEIGVFEATVKPLIAIFSNKYSIMNEIVIYNESFDFQSKISYKDILAKTGLELDTTSNLAMKLLYDKIELNSVLLKDIIQFSRGIKTSDDKRFVLKEYKDNDCFKVYRGKNIKAYSLNWNGEYIWYRPDLMKEKVGCVPSSKDFFEVPEKLVTQRVNSSFQLLVAYDNEQNYFLDTVNVSRYSSWNNKVALKYLCGLLNSKLINFWYCNKFNMPTVGIYEIHSVPIKIAPNQTSIINLVEKIITEKKLTPNAHANSLQTQIDNFVYKLYELTYEEVKVIDYEFRLSKREYENLRFD